MEFDGTFTVGDVSSEEAWLALSDPYMIKQSLPAGRPYNPSATSTTSPRSAASWIARIVRRSARPCRPS